MGPETDLGFAGALPGRIFKDFQTNFRLDFQWNIAIAIHPPVSTVTPKSGSVGRRPVEGVWCPPPPRRAPLAPGLGRGLAAGGLGNGRVGCYMVPQDPPLKHSEILRLGSAA